MSEPTISTAHGKMGLIIKLDRETAARLTNDDGKVWAKANPDAKRGFVIIGSAPFQDAGRATPYPSQGKKSEYRDYVRLGHTATFPGVSAMPAWDMVQTAAQWEGDLLFIDAPAVTRVHRRAKKALATVRPPAPPPTQHGTLGQESGGQAAPFMSVSEAVRVINDAKRAAGPGMLMALTPDGQLIVNFAMAGL